MISIRQLSKIYRTGETELAVFRALDLEIAPGELVAIVGESGAGKSTLLHILAGLDSPSAGTVSFRNRDIAEMSEVQRADYRNREIGFVWQQPRLLAEFTAQENVMMPLLVRGVSHRDSMDTAGKVLDEVGLSARACHRAGEMSGGEQQRVAIARAMAGGPSILLADEPTGNLDETTAEKVFSLFTSLRAKRGLTTVLVTHNLRFANSCDRAMRLENGLLSPL